MGKASGNRMTALEGDLWTEISLTSMVGVIDAQIMTGIETGKGGETEITTRMIEIGAQLTSLMSRPVNF